MWRESEKKMKFCETKAAFQIITFFHLATDKAKSGEASLLQEPFFSVEKILIEKKNSYERGLEKLKSKQRNVAIEKQKIV